MEAVGIVTTSLESLKTYRKKNSIPNPIEGRVLIGIKTNNNQFLLFDPTTKTAEFYPDSYSIKSTVLHKQFNDIKNEPYIFMAIFADLEQINSFNALKKVSLTGTLKKQASIIRQNLNKNSHTR